MSIRAPRFATRAPSVAALLIACALVISAMRARQQEFGDGREYVLQTQSIVFDRSLVVDPATRGEYWNRTNPFGVELHGMPTASPADTIPRSTLARCVPSFGSLYYARDGRCRFAHPWAYSLAAAPAYAAMHALFPGSGEYLAFRLINVIALFVPLIMLWALSPTWSALVFFILVLTSPLTPHLQWAHSELFCFGAVLTAFATLRHERVRWVGPLLLGLGAAQNVPILLFFPLHAWLQSREHPSLARSTMICTAVPYLIGASLPLLMMAYYYHNFGTFNLIATIGGANISQITLRRMSSVFFSPAIGVVWYFPAAWLAAVVAWRKPDRLVTFFTCVSVALVAALCSATTNINSAQLSSPRYAVWFLAPLYFLPFAGRFLRSGPPSLFDTSGRKAALVAVVGILLWLQTGRFILGAWKQFYSLNRANSRVAKMYRFTHFHDDIEPLVENIQGKELMLPLSLSGIYVWNLGGGESLFIISKRAWRELRSLTVIGDVATLERTSDLLDLFIMTRDPSGSLLLSRRPNVTFQSHPHWGGYRMVWVHGQIDGVESSPSGLVRVTR